MAKTKIGRLLQELADHRATRRFHSMKTRLHYDFFVAEDGGDKARENFFSMKRWEVEAQKLLIKTKHKRPMYWIPVNQRYKNALMKYKKWGWLSRWIPSC